MTPQATQTLSTPLGERRVLRRGAKALDNLATRFVWTCGCGVAVIAPFLAVPDSAMAQSASTFPLRYGAVENLTDDESYDEVLSRPRPDYDAVGIHVRSFFVMPSVTSTVIFDDNVFATGSSTQSDVTLHTNPELFIRSDWPRHSLQTRFTLDDYRHKRFSDEDHTDYSALAEGRLDVLRDINVTGLAAYRHGAVERGTDDSVLRVDKLIAFDQAQAESFVNAAFGRMFAKVGAKIQTSNYDDTSIAATQFDQDYRDGTVGEAIVRLGYDVTPLTGVFLQGSYNRRRFDNATYDSEGVRAVAGVAFEASRLIKGEAYAGYLQQDYASSGFDDLMTWTVGGRLAWQPSPLMTVSLEGKREADQSSFSNGSSVVDNDATFRVDYEFRRNIILSGLYGLKLEDYQGSRTDTTMTWGGEARYLINRRFSVGIEGTHVRFESDFADDYRRNRIEVSGRFQY